MYSIICYKCTTWWFTTFKGCTFLVSLVAQLVKNLPAMWETWVRSLAWEDPLEKGMATQSSILAWRIPWTEEPGRLQSMGSQRVGLYWATFTFHFHTLFLWIVIGLGKLFGQPSIIKYWLYSLCCTIYPYSLLILYIKVCTLSPLPLHCPYPHRVDSSFMYLCISGAKNACLPQWCLWALRGTETLARVWVCGWLGVVQAAPPCSPMV